MHQFTFVVEPYGDGWGFGMEGRKVLYHHSDRDNVISTCTNLVRRNQGILKIKDARGKCIMETDFAQGRGEEGCLNSQPISHRA